MPAVAVPLLVANWTLAPLARLVPVRVSVIEAVEVTASGSVVSVRRRAELNRAALIVVEMLTTACVGLTS